MLPTTADPEIYHWHVLRVLPRQDAKTSKYLSKIGLEHYTPCKKGFFEEKGVGKEGMRHVLSPYLFVKCRAVQRKLVFYGGSVIDFLKEKGQPVHVSPFEIDRLRKIFEEHMEADWSGGPVKVGDAVEISQGFLKGIRGLAVEDHGKWHMYVLIEALGRFVRFSIARKQLRRLDPHKA
ncbi:MAG: hypothetical protein IPH93_03230 [Saprospiraceae bacterium]|nr:hypothetical protein [Saprospiraceae bacterium]